MHRRQFISSLGKCACAAGALNALPALHSAADASSIEPKVEARWYEKLPYKKIRCLLCPRECLIDNLETGYCGVRTNREGVYYTLVHGNPVTFHNDPIEKKPLFHFLPGTKAFSLATVGCNVNCKFCQNWEISQVGPDQVPAYDFSPDAVVSAAKQSGSASIAYTYTEPVVFAEYVHDTAAVGRKRGLRSVMISNGYINPQPLTDLCQVLDAVKVDLKAFTQKFYTELVVGELKPVLDALQLLVKLKMWTEIVYLVIPGWNDDPGEIKEMAQWIKQDLNHFIPLHFSRFYPQYLLKNVPPTPISTLEKCHDICRREGLKYVYIGNVPNHKAEKTHCHNCNKIIVDRSGYLVESINIQSGKCAFCHTPIPGLWS